MKYIQITLLVLMFIATMWHFRHMTPAERHTCLVTESNKTICK